MTDSERTSIVVIVLQELDDILGNTAGVPVDIGDEGEYIAAVNLDDLRYKIEKRISEIQKAHHE